MSLFRDLEKSIDSKLKKLFASENAEAQGRELVEIQRAILEEVEDRAQLLPRARRRFPYNELLVRIAATEAGPPRCHRHRVRGSRRPSSRDSQTPTE